MIIRTNLVKYIFGKHIGAVALWPFILVNPSLPFSGITEYHEKIHWRQQLEMLLLPFYLWYGIEFLVRWWQCKDFNKAYQNISFEREAYKNDENPQYLKQRKMYSWTKYL